MNAFYNSRLIIARSNSVMPSPEAAKTQDLVSNLLQTTNPVDTLTLIKVFGFFLLEKENCVERHLKMDIFKCNLETYLGTTEYRETRDEVLELFNHNPLYFLRFGLNLVCDFTQFCSVINSCGFNFRDKQIAFLALVILILETETYPIDSLSFIKISRDLSNAGFQNTMTIHHLDRIVQSLLDWQFQGSSKIKKKQAIIQKSENYAFTISDKIKHELAITSLEDQLKAACLIYSNLDKNGQEILSILGQNLIQMPFSKRTIQEKIRTCDDIMSMIQLTEPLDFLCYHIRDKNYVYKRRENEINRGKSEIRKTDADLECGISFSIFTSMVKQDDRLLIAFPSPLFIKKWTLDSMLSHINVCFLVQSEYEKELLSFQFGGKLDTKKYPKVTQIDIKTITDIEQEVLFQQHFTKVIIFAGQQESFQKKRSINRDKKKNSVLAADIEKNTTQEIRTNCKESLIKLNYYITNSNTIISVFCLCSEFSFYYKDLFSRAFAETKTFNFNKIFLLPDHLPDIAGPKQKCFWIAEKNKGIKTKTELIKTYFVQQQAYRFSAITQLEPTKTFYWEDFLKGDISLRKSFTSIERNDGKPNFALEKTQSVNRKSCEEIAITKEIFAYYTKSYLPQAGKFRVYVYLKDENKKKISSSIRRKDFAQTENIISWITNEYPMTAKYSRDSNALGKTEIRDIIVKEYCKRLKNKSISLKSLLFVYKNQIIEETGVTENELKLVEYLVFSNNILGNSIIDEVSAETISEYVMNEKSYSKISKRTCIEVFSLLLDFAVKNGNCITNEFAEIARGIKREGAMTAYLRSTLAQKTFSRDEDQQLLLYIKNRLSQNEDIYIGVLIKFLTGLETSAILSLLWEDFYLVERFNFYQLHIYQQFSQRQKKVVTLKNITDYRCIPCSDFLTTELITLYQKKAKNRDFKKTDFIVSDSETNGKIPVAHDSLRKRIKDSIKIVKGTLDDVDIDQESTCITRWYAGDILRENFKFMATDFANFTPDEIAYILGNQTDTTAAQHYIDFKNEISQLLLYVKMRRIDAITSTNKEFFAEPQRGTLSSGTKKVFSENSCKNPLYVNLVSKRSSSTIDFSISAKARYGLNIQVVTSNKEEGK